MEKKSLMGILKNNIDIHLLFFFFNTRMVFVYNDFSFWHIIFILDNHFPS